MPFLALHADYVQLTSSHGQSSSSAVQVLEDVTVHRHIINHGNQMRSEGPSRKTAFGLVAPPARAVSFAGMRWTSDDIAVSSDGGLNLFTPEPASFIWVVVDAAHVQPGLASGPGKPGLAKPHPARTETLRKLRSICASAFERNEDGKVAAESSTTHLRELIVQTLRSALTGSEVVHESPIVNRYRKIVSRAEAFMWENIFERLDLKSIASAAGCGVRTLTYCFSRTYGLGPLCYFKIHRLNAVRLALETDNKMRPILDIAADYGFWHQGHFGADYRKLFGVTPSDTRREAASIARSTSRNAVDHEILT